jgi:flagellar L-ring protein precursor FlgH
MKAGFAIVIAGLTATAALAAEPTEVDRLQAMRLQPTGSLYSHAMAARTPEAVATPGEAQAPVSLTAVPPARPKKYKKNDLVAIIVRQDSEASTSATTDLKRKQDFDFAIEQFLEFARFAGTGGIGNVANPGKLPEIKFKFDNSRNADANNARNDHMSARITAKIVDVKPNGTIVVEATAHIRNDREEQTIRLSGVARSEDITVDNTLLSTQLADLNLVKETKGEVKDGTKRSWLNNFIDKVGP